MSSTETMRYVAPTEATASKAEARSYESNSNVQPTFAEAQLEPTPEMIANYDKPPKIALKMPDGCVPIRVGARIVYSVPQYMESVASDWYSIQYQMMELKERRPVVESLGVPTEVGVDVSAETTTRDALRSILAGEKYHAQALADLEYHQTLKAAEQRLVRIIAQSEHIDAQRRIAAAEAALHRTKLARERLMREAPEASHERLKELELERKKVVYDVNEENGHVEANRIAWLREKIAEAQMSLATDSPPPSNPQAVAYDLREWQRQLAEREAKLTAIDKEVASIEARMLEG